MNVYDLLLLVGGFGFLAMALLGMSHGSAGHGHGLGHGHGASVGHSHSHVGKGMHLPKGARVGLKGRSSTWLMLLSPIDLFSMALGAGAVGILFKSTISPSMLVWAAIAGALVFDFLVIKPVFGLAMKFVSKPSEGLEGMVKLEGEAITRFDNEGRGIVCLNMDGQLVQLLAELDGSERELGETVAKGDPITVLSVDAKRNRCTVSKLTVGRNP